ncbi:NarL family two-component system sensor histidine kinase LiaS [Tumebacillus sp. BK434]|nr:NarL family two-component system sensor histidine kinase LiaS [Tumebacillus sp. BK434]
MRFRSVRWSMLLAYVRASAAALAVFSGLVMLGAMLWELFADRPLLPDAIWTGGLFTVVVIAALLSIVLIGGVTGYVEARSFRRKMIIFHEAILLWANGRLGHRVAVQEADDEMEDLAGALNRMAERLEEQKSALERLVETNEQLYQQAAGLAALEERARLSRDLHDSVSQQLFALGMTAGAANKLLALDVERARPLVAQTEEMAAKAQAEMRALLLQLRPVELEGRSLREALERFLHDVCPRHGIRYDLDVEQESRLPEGLESQLFRVVQEAVSNVIRHAAANTLQVRLVREDDVVALTVRDDGAGFDTRAAKDGSFGLHGIRERALEIGGRCEVRSSPGLGTEVRVSVQLLNR